MGAVLSGLERGRMVIKVLKSLVTGGPVAPRSRPARCPRSAPVLALVPLRTFPLSLTT